MHVEFVNDDLDRLETDPAYTMRLGSPLVKAYRMRLQGIRAAVDERDLYAMKSWRFEKLAGARRHQHSLRLNGQYRLIVEIVKTDDQKRIRIVRVEDYH